MSRPFVSFSTAVVVSACLATLFVAAPEPDTMYRSTDFEVHRYWKAVTGTQRLRLWYRAADSVWTLDYPPFFAYFEYVLAAAARGLRALKDKHCAVAVLGGRLGHVDVCAPMRWAAAELYDQALLDVKASSPASPAIQRFMRLTVVLCSVVPLAVVLAYLGQASRCRTVWLLAFASAPALVLLDLVHFQYNGLVFAAAAVALVAPIATGIAACFVLLMLKHLFAYYVFGYGLAALTHLAEPARGRGLFVLTTALALAVVVALGAGPLIIDEIGTWPPATTTRVAAATVEALTPVKERLFPFGRGLCHAYWAPNLYPLYNVVDRVGCKLLGRCVPTSVNTKGLVTLSDATDGVDLSKLPTHSVLPSVNPLAALVAVCVTFGLLVACFHRRRNRPLLLFASSVAFFAASWHVHEKAMLTVLLPAVVGCVAPTTAPHRIGALWRWTRCLALLCTLTIAPLFPGVRQMALKYLLGAAHDALLGALCSGVEGRPTASSRTAPRVHAALWLVVAPASLWVDWDALRAGQESSFAPLMALSCTGSIAFVVVAVALARELGARCA